VDLWARGQAGGDVLIDSKETVTEYALTGTIRGAGADIDVREQNSSHYVSMYSVGFLPSQRGYANDLRGTTTTSVKVGNDNYSFANVQGQAIDKEKGGQRTSGVLALSGQILRNGAPFATCTLQGDRPVAIAGGTAIPLALAIRAVVRDRNRSSRSQPRVDSSVTRRYVIDDRSARRNTRW
jgi:hypothetical protein